ncbi:MAG: PAS domain-containing protein, partial [Gammaproteobacteria bacterium]|nr:PAS domain-containing protein [Gammaproteobacteria bacterium]
MKDGENLHVLIVEESNNDAESLANALRNAGYSINFNHGAETAAIESTLQEQHPDIVLCGSGESLASPEDVQALLDKHGLTAPMIVIADEAPEDKVVAARISGFAALISYDQPDHLYLAFEKEATCIRLQQQLKTSSDNLRASQNRCHALIENSGDAVAYIHEGMHVYANQPYMELFSIETAEDVEGTPILDMISNNERATFREFLKNYLDNKDHDNTLEINFVNPESGT